MSLARHASITLIALFSLTGGLIASASAATTPRRATLQEVAEGMTCQCGCGLTVANCNHPSCGFAVPIRKEITEMIDRGMDRAAILATFRQKYGEKILSAPTTEGFNILAWITPFAAVGVGAILVILAVAGWSKAGRQTARGADREDANDTRLRRELREDVLRRL